MRSAPISLDPRRLGWGPRTKNFDVVTASPQKLYRYINDALLRRGFTRKFKQFQKEPKISSLPIAQTADVSGEIFRRKGPFEELFPWKLIRVIGLIVLIIGIVLLLESLVPWLMSSELYSLEGASEFMDTELYPLIGSIVLVVAGAIMVRMNRCRTDVIWVRMVGEVYGSKLGMGVKLPHEYANSSRYSMISEIRLIVGGRTVYTTIKAKKHVPVSPRNAKSTIREDFDFIIHEISDKILPKVILQKTWEQTQHEYVARDPSGHTRGRPPAPQDAQPPPPPGW